jgi:hypothetical protein
MDTYLAARKHYLPYYMDLHKIQLCDNFCGLCIINCTVEYGTLVNSLATFMGAEKLF